MTCIYINSIHYKCVYIQPTILDFEHTTVTYFTINSSNKTTFTKSAGHGETPSSVPLVIMTKLLVSRFSLLFSITSSSDPQT